MAGVAATQATPDRYAPVRQPSPRRLLWLKWTLVRRGLMRDRTRLIGAIVFLALMLPVAVLLGVASYLLYANLPRAAAAELLFAVLALLFVGWLVVPIFLYTLNDSVDPSKLFHYPLSPPRLMLGLLLTSILDLPVLFLAALFAAVMAGWARAPAAIVIVPLALVLLYALTVAASQALVTSSRKPVHQALLAFGRAHRHRLRAGTPSCRRRCARRSGAVHQRGNTVSPCPRWYSSSTTRGSRSRTTLGKPPAAHVDRHAPAEIGQDVGGDLAHLVGAVGRHDGQVLHPAAGELDLPEAREHAVRRAAHPRAHHLVHAAHPADRHHDSSSPASATIACGKTSSSATATSTPSRQTCRAPTSRRNNASSLLGGSTPRPPTSSSRSTFRSCCSTCNVAASSRLARARTACPPAACCRRCRVAVRR